MQIHITLEQFHGLTKRLDIEIATALHQQLQSHVEIDLVDPRKLNTGIIFAAQTNKRRFEIRSAFIPVTKKVAGQCNFSASTAKYISSRLVRSKYHDSWQLDPTFGEGGYCAFCPKSIDEDSVLQIADVIAESILYNLSPMHA